MCWWIDLVQIYAVVSVYVCVPTVVFLSVCMSTRVHQLPTRGRGHFSNSILLSEISESQPCDGNGNGLSIYVFVAIF